ncbi:hypothetical protein Tco_1440253 [Tanacetum coccineum]
MAVLPNIPCPIECEIVGKLLVDHALRYALTAIVDVLGVYIQQFWKSVKQVPNHIETYGFMVDKQEITYIVDIFHATLKLPMETPEQPFIPPASLKYIQSFLKIVGYKGLVDKVSVFYTKNLAKPWKTMFKVFNRCLTSQTSRHDQTKINILQIFQDCPRFTKLIIVDIMAKFESIPKRLEEVYHSIKDDTPLAYKDYKGVCKEDSGDRLEPESQKENPEKIDDDDDDVDEKKDNKKDDDDDDDHDSCINQNSKITSNATNDLIEDNLPRIGANAVKKERESSQAINTVLNVHHTTSASTATTTSEFQKPRVVGCSSSKQPVKDTNTSASKQQQKQQDWNAWVDIPVVDKDEVILEDETLELIEEL